MVKRQGGIRMPKVYIEKEKVDVIRLRNDTGHTLLGSEFVIIGEFAGVVDRNTEDGEYFGLQIAPFLEIQAGDFIPGDYKAGGIVYFDSDNDKFSDQPGEKRKPVGITGCNYIKEHGYFTFHLYPQAGSTGGGSGGATETDPVYTADKPHIVRDSAIVDMATQTWVNTQIAAASGIDVEVDPVYSLDKPLIATKLYVDDAIANVDIGSGGVGLDAIQTAIDDGTLILPVDRNGISHIFTDSGDFWSDDLKEGDVILYLGEDIADFGLNNGGLYRYHSGNNAIDDKEHLGSLAGTNGNIHHILSTPEQVKQFMVPSLWDSRYPVTFLYTGDYYNKQNGSAQLDIPFLSNYVNELNKGDILQVGGGNGFGSCAYLGNICGPASDNSGPVDSTDLISADTDNAISIGTDGKLFAAPSAGGSGNGGGAQLFLHVVLFTHGSAYYSKYPVITGKLVIINSSPDDITTVSEAFDTAELNKIHQIIGFSGVGRAYDTYDGPITKFEYNFLSYLHFNSNGTQNRNSIPFENVGALTFYDTVIPIGAGGSASAPSVDVARLYQHNIVLVTYADYMFMSTTILNNREEAFDYATLKTYIQDNYANKILPAAGSIANNNLPVYGIAITGNDLVLKRSGSDVLIPEYIDIVDTVIPLNP
jgi:hypothetical protein